ncbi:LytTR family transcriptional regulator DNA-binding domain-containing protein [Acholeplasma equirhinis]|uniref:LytTR family DNA-binding domain-containing protein n=1 Tax=Acholeplasma equirhinis TaxID=555393 RepID=UPI00197AB205|nr:LytTR family DNA-binding domain-containing protein [Acholeplasma equirhinis]MBN3490158.1 LytTR family transcriptional regulator DNA-binding domain-containing protein [Acholeplasma equirhinis]
MIKVILNKADLSLVQPELNIASGIQVVEETNQITMIMDEKHYEVLERILKRITINRKEIVFETPEGWAKIYIRDILYIESFGTEIYIHTQSQGEVEVKQPLYQLEEMLSNFNIIRIGKSYLVNLSKVVFIKTKLNAKLELELQNGDKLEVMRSYVKSFKERLGIGGKK